MGKSIKSREARQQAADLAVAAVLQSHSKFKARSRAAERYDDSALIPRIEAHRGYALRRPEDWQCRLKSRSSDRRFLDLVRFCFGKYRVPSHLENAWFGDCRDDFVDRSPALAMHGRAGKPSTFRDWYIVATQGRSLYKVHTSPFLSKQETHHFLTAPDNVQQSQKALWYAVARAQTDRADVAWRISATKLDDYSIASSFWKDVARFFARHSLAVHEMNNLIDYFRAMNNEDEAFSLKGRTLESLRRRQEEWHRAIRKMNAIGGGSWNGRDLPDVDYEAGSERDRAIWRFRQIKTGKDLFKEGQRMRHCVVTYKELCMGGHVSIWSVCAEYPVGQVNRGVTLEVRNDGAIVQCRGFANRLPYANEVAMVQRWANDHGLSWRSLE